MSVRVYIVEDHEDMRLILKRTLSKRLPQLEIVGESESAERAEKEFPTVQPDLVLVDISLPGVDGIELVRRLRRFRADLPVYILTAHEIEYYRAAALDAGALGIFSKGNLDELIEALRQAIADRNG